MLTPDLIKNNLNIKDNVFVAYSGGPDSSVLLDLCVKLREISKINLSAIHVNHNLSKKSIDWEKHCIDVCKKLSVNLVIESAEISSDGGGLESAARKARYKIFKNILKENDQILLGHHSDDVAETIFMRILRGTGLEGIDGPKDKRDLNYDKYFEKGQDEFKKINEYNSSNTYQLNPKEIAKLISKHKVLKSFIE